MKRPQYVKYSSPDFIGVVHSMRSRDVKPRGWLFLLQGGAASEHIKAAQYIAFETRLKLVKIKLSRIVGKFIGETEKNLNAILEQTKASRAIIFLAGADLLFDNRSDQQGAEETLQIFGKGIDKTLRIMLLSCSAREQIKESLLGQIDVVAEFRSLK